MAKSQEKGTTILLGLKGCKVGTVTEIEDRAIIEVKAEQRKPVCPYRGWYRKGGISKIQGHNL